MENENYKEVNEYIFYNPKKNVTALVNTKTGSVTYKTHDCDWKINKHKYMASSMGSDKDSIFWLSANLKDEGYEFIEVLDGSIK